MKNSIIAPLAFIIISLYALPVFSEEEIQYKKFKLETVSCDAGILYRKTPRGMDVGVSSIATGKGAEFRKWEITDIRLRIDGEAVRPDKTGKFYVRKESLFRVPAAVLFAALGTQVDVGGSSLEQGIAKAGMAVGLGLLVLQAHGDIAGENCTFNIDHTLADRIQEGTDTIEITMEDETLHLKETVKIGLVKPAFGAAPKVDYQKMSRDDLIRLVDTLEVEVADLEKDQSSYKYGEDPQYDEIQRRIEELQTERGIAYKAWFEKRQVK